MKPARSGKHLVHERLVRRILEGDGTAPVELRRAAFENSLPDEPLKSLAAKVALHPAQISDLDIAAAKSAGLPESALFELIICAAVGQSTRDYDAALAALNEALSERGA